MLTSEQFKQEGEHPFFFSGLAGQLEALLTVPSDTKQKIIALVGHPHSLQGGTMNNKVVTTLVRAFKESKISSIRFNFRGVGRSEGHYDAGIGESEDLLALMRLCQQSSSSELGFIFAGFSFGSYVAYRAAAQTKSELLITVAPPVHHYNYLEFPPPNPWVIFQGDEDELVPLSLISDFSQQFSPVLDLYSFAKTSHFFHGKLTELKTIVHEVLKSRVPHL